MFHLLKFIVWLAGIAVVIYFTLPFFGYEINMGYFDKSKKICRQRLDECSRNLLKQGTENFHCDLMCVDPELIIKKQ